MIWIDKVGGGGITGGCASPGEREVICEEASALGEEEQDGWGAEGRIPHGNGATFPE